ncbi:MAG: phage holin family protein [Flavobacteriaceae bacterium]
MNTILKLLLTAVAVLVISSILPGVTVVDFDAAFKVSLVLGLLKIFIRPIIIFSTLPITIVTLGLFLFVINTSLILMTDYFLDGFTVNGFWIALLFSLLLSASQSVLYSLLKKENTIQKRY